MTKPKLLSAALLTATALTAAGSAGCSSPYNDTVVPGYTARERDVEIARNISLEGKQFLDDVDRHVFMWRPVSQLSYFNIRQMSP